jgi:hypothetical protein
MQPNISDISPSEGSPLGGDIVRIIGQNFGPQVAVYFGGFPAAVIALRREIRGPNMVLDVRTGRGRPGVVEVHVQNIKDGQPVPGESASAPDAFRYRKSYLGSETPLLDLVRELLHNIRESVLDNSTISTAIEYSEAFIGKDAEVLPVTQLPALILAGPQLEENRFYSLNTTQDVVVGSEIRRKSPPITVDLVFSLIGASRSTKEILNLATHTIQWASRQRWVVIQDRRWEMDTRGRVSTSTGRELRTFHAEIVVRGFDLDAGQLVGLTQAVQNAPDISLGDF